MSPAWRRLCCYCHQAIVDDVEGPLEADSGLWVLPPPDEPARLSHGICGPCLELKIAALPRGRGGLPPAAPSNLPWLIG
ncbi:MAG: hypothetical protein AABZ64_18065 [Nitrospinota bacterium]